MQPMIDQSNRAGNIFLIHPYHVFVKTYYVDDFTVTRSRKAQIYRN